MTSRNRVLILAGIAWSAATALIAAEHHGIVTFHGLPVPGAAVTASQGDSKLTTSTDEDGTYSFRDLPDGNWTVEVQMAGFTKASREIGVTPGAPPPTWDLKLAPQTLPAATATAAPAGPLGAVRGPGGAGGAGGAVPAGGRGAPPMTPEQARARAAAQRAAQDQTQSRAAAVAAIGGGGGGGDALVLAGSVGSGGGGISAGNAIAGSQYNGNASFSLTIRRWTPGLTRSTGSRRPNLPSPKDASVSRSAGR